MEDDGEHNLKMLLVIKDEKTSEKKIQMREYPSFELLFELQVRKIFY